MESPRLVQGDQYVHVPSDDKVLLLIHGGVPMSSQGSLSPTFSCTERLGKPREVFIAEAQGCVMHADGPCDGSEGTGRGTAIGQPQSRRLPGLLGQRHR